MYPFSTLYHIRLNGRDLVTALSRQRQIRTFCPRVAAGPYRPWVLKSPYLTQNAVHLKTYHPVERGRKEGEAERNGGRTYLSGETFPSTIPSLPPSFLPLSKILLTRISTTAGFETLPETILPGCNISHVKDIGWD